MSMKNPLTPAGIEPATFRIVAQHLKHCATAVPVCVCVCVCVCMYCSVHNECKHEWTRNLKRVHSLVKVPVVVIVEVASDREALEKVQ